MLCKTIQIYENTPNVTLSTYLWEPSKGLYSGLRPAIIVCPGGAYLHCAEYEGEPVALRFANMGYHAFVLRYSTFDADPGEEGNPKAAYPGPLRDIGKAMLTIREHAAEWNVDINRVALCGFSAGGHNVGMFAAYWNAPVLTEYFHRPAEEFRPAACILGYPVTDFGQLMKLLGAEHPLCLMMNRAYLGDELPSEEMLRTTSVPDNVGTHTPPMFIWHTSTDRGVPVLQSTKLLEALYAAQVPFEAHIYEGGDHGLSTADQASALVSSMLDRAVATWTGLANTWLQKRFALDIPAIFQKPQ